MHRKVTEEAAAVEIISTAVTFGTNCVDIEQGETSKRNVERRTKVIQV